MYRSDQATPETLSISTLETQEIQSNARDARTMLDGVVNAMNDASRNSDDPYSALRDQDPPGYSRGENPRPYSDNVSERRSGIMGGSAIELVASKAIAAPSLCSATCKCPCHSHEALRTPQVLQQITGRLFVGYTGRPALRPRCIDSCSKRNAPSMNVTYFFPK